MEVGVVMIIITVGLYVNIFCQHRLVTVSLYYPTAEPKTASCLSRELTWNIGCVNLVQPVPSIFAWSTAMQSCLYFSPHLTQVYIFQCFIALVFSIYKTMRTFLYDTLNLLLVF